MDFKKKFADFQEFNFFTKLKPLNHIFFILIMHKDSLWSRDVPQKNLGPIGSAVLKFIGYKQTNRQTDRQAKFIYRYMIN